MKTYFVSFILLAILVFTVLMMRGPVAQEAAPTRTVDSHQGDAEFQMFVEQAMARLDARIAQLEKQPLAPAMIPAQPPSNDESMPAWAIAMRREIQELDRAVGRLQMQIQSADRETNNLPRELDQIRQSIRSLESSVNRLQLK
ncbi:hypothetical protein Poly51_19310 [Rubripirellula tenax]|uniref:Uncharacterized protein n=1 Tax=Rubripirellula tenax TaxID=2528015 RepID=A0A5C6FCL0_9BACT|nr:hypothetical protein [Rubripirellula tenax]TWU59145.1 hypothetical protein Poly51_19310 [Rubripirellula tenax]